MIYLTDENFENEIQKAKKLILVDFWALWCPSCLLLSPILEKLEKEFEEEIVFAKVNVDAAPKTSQRFGINPIPTVILFKNGKPISGFVGARPESQIREWLKSVLKEGGETKIGSLIEKYKEYAKQNGFSLNPNREVVERIIRGLLENEKKYGKRFCPCRRVTGNQEDRLKICPCVWHRQEIEKNGHCLCGLLVK